MRIIYGSILLIAIAGLAWAGIERETRIGPTRSTTNVTISAAGAGNRNCISELDAVASADYSINVLNGGTTIYTLATTSATVVVRSWDDIGALCGSADTAMYINMSSGTTLGNAFINYSGFTY